MTESQRSDDSEIWEDIFPFKPYPNQREGINQSIDTVRDGGVFLLEGPCGTGKTLIALTAGISLVKDPETKYDRVLVITSKKQQLSAFESDLRTINRKTDNNIPGLTLVGKADLCPYVQAGEIEKEDIYHRCIELRDNTRSLMAKAARQNNSREANAAFGLFSYAQREPSVEDTLTFDGAKAGVQPSIPTVAGKEYCPFYAKHITNSVKDSFPLSIFDVTTGEETLKTAARAGTCPHVEMRRLHDEGMALFGNYQHAFNPKTVAGFTGGIIDDTTLLICDEAHELVHQVRDQLSYSVNYSTFSKAADDITLVQRWITGKGHPRKCQLADAVIGNTGLTGPDLLTASKFVERIQDEFHKSTIQGLRDELGTNWKDKCRRKNRDELSIALQNPQNPGPDSIRKWVEDNDYEDIWEKTLLAARAVSVARDVISREVDEKSPDGSFAISDVYELLNRWWTGGDSEYFREIKLIPRKGTRSTADSTRPWRTGYYAQVQINNAIPQNEIAATLDTFGGAILMSATLSPLDIYEEVTGVKKLREGTQPTSSLVTKAIASANIPEGDEDTVHIPDIGSVGGGGGSTQSPSTDRQRNVGKVAFDLGFPQENRASFAVDAQKFTYSNRWPPDEHPELRTTYGKTITSVVNTTPGNVIVFMPSYLEAMWASRMLDGNPNVTKPVLTDTSSSDAATEELKQAFFDGEPKVLATSLRGTLTEGVDFDGDKLNAAVVCGVPITNTSTNLSQAIQSAYDERFDNNGFDFAFTVPAVRKTRQALGRVIRGVEDVGVRVLIDERYANSRTFTSVREHFPEHATDEFRPISPPELGRELQHFWSQH
ncbi:MULTISPECIES: ATP-dependent DNA helicase [Haloferacaceae]|uniref:ATP-dependent DNA helicase n=2 Tax=Haloferacaceae TaxID=1644056 RepID=A0ABD6DAK8_9EURY|nr:MULTISPECIES: ATP-dependent DNA helicase [Halorubraceae]